MITLSAVQLILVVILGGLALLGAFLFGVKLTAKQERIVVSHIREILSHSRDSIVETRNAAQQALKQMEDHYKNALDKLDKNKDGHILDDLLKEAEEFGSDAVDVIKKLQTKLKGKK